jgi:hypothetical protein
MFQDYVRNLHVNFEETKIPSLTVSTLLLHLGDKIRVLKHTDEWTEADSTQSSAMASAAGTILTPQLEEIVPKQVKAQSNQLLEHHKALNTPKPKTFVHQDLMFIPPKTPGETRLHNGKIFNWYTKCHQGHGQWVSAYDNTTHIEGLARKKIINNAMGFLKAMAQRTIIALLMLMAKHKYLSLVFNRQLMCQMNACLLSFPSRMALHLVLIFPILMMTDYIYIEQKRTPHAACTTVYISLH